jgi:hypothetical protein
MGRWRRRAWRATVAWSIVTSICEVAMTVVTMPTTPSPRSPATTATAERTTILCTSCLQLLMEGDMNEPNVTSLSTTCSEYLPGFSHGDHANVPGIHGHGLMQKESVRPEASTDKTEQTRL